MREVLEKIQHGRVTQASCHSDLLRKWQAALWAWGNFHHISPSPLLQAVTTLTGFILVCDWDVWELNTATLPSGKSEQIILHALSYIAVS